MASFSQTEHAVTCNQIDENQPESFKQPSLHSLAASVPTNYSAHSSLTSHQTTIHHTSTQYDDQDFKNDEDYLRSLHYDLNRSKQEKLLLFTNIFRLLVVFILAPIIYLLV